MSRECSRRTWRINRLSRWLGVGVVLLTAVRPRGGVVHDRRVHHEIVVGGRQLSSIRQGGWLVGIGITFTFDAATKLGSRSTGQVVEVV
jgi:hypothetical protein